MMSTLFVMNGELSFRKVRFQSSDREGYLLGLSNRLKQIFADLQQAVGRDTSIFNHSVELGSEHGSTGLGCVANHALVAAASLLDTDHLLDQNTYA
jgi:hypothetical protein